MVLRWFYMVLFGVYWRFEGRFSETHLLVGMNDDFWGDLHMMVIYSRRNIHEIY
jgi:hypothetical protein